MATTIPTKYILPVEERRAKLDAYITQCITRVTTKLEEKIQLQRALGVRLDVMQGYRTMLYDIRGACAAYEMIPAQLRSRIADAECYGPHNERPSEQEKAQLFDICSDLHKSFKSRHNPSLLDIIQKDIDVMEDADVKEIEKTEDEVTHINNNAVVKLKILLADLQLFKEKYFDAFIQARESDEIYEFTDDTGYHADIDMVPPCSVIISTIWAEKHKARTEQQKA
jgi:hypothetical protein